MPVSSHDVAAVLRERIPGLPTKKLHKLLYYCQGHYLAAFGEPLFGETISAWDMGPVVGTLWFAEKQTGQSVVRADLSESALNTVGYVISRYGQLTGRDLENLTHSETPWQRANERRRPKESARIELDWLKEYFEQAGSADADDDDVMLDSAEVSHWLENAEARLSDALHDDEYEVLQARLTSSGRA